MSEKILNQSDSRQDCGISLRWLETANMLTALGTSLSKPTYSRRHRHSPAEIASELKVDENGVLWWRRQKTGRSRPRVLDKPVGSIHLNGNYIQINFNSTRYLAHTVCWVLYYGKWPERQLDHIDGDTLNNRKDNLREVSSSENKHNPQKLYATNTTGYPGITYFKRDGTYIVRLSVNGTRIYGGTFKTLDGAIVKRALMEKRYGVHAHSLLGKQFIGGKRQDETTK